MTRGFSSIGLVRPKNVANAGAVLRAAHVYGAALVAIQGDRTSLNSGQYTTKAARHLPVLRGDDLFAMCPHGATPVAIDLVDGAVPLPRFTHPERSFYVFRPEDGTLGATHLSKCKYRVMVPTKFWRLPLTSSSTTEWRNAAKLCWRPHRCTH
jgi:tRNA(Leu) C34 or U34 (ribose-2'-O)-methylase TrmL